MDDSSWTKCCATMGFSSSSQDLPPLNQILNGSFDLYSFLGPKPTSSIQTHAPPAAPMSPWTSNSVSNCLGQSKLGSSFSPILFAPPCVTYNQVPARGSNGGGSASGTEFPHVSSGLLAQNRDTQIAEAVMTLGLARMSEYQGSSYGVDNVFLGGYPSLQKMELPTTGSIHRKLFCNENQLNSPTLKVGYVNDATSCNVWKINASDTFGVPQKVLSCPNPSVSCLTSSLSSGCPKVFCFGLSGYLLLSNTGLLGVLCSCHGLHMSIAKFSEHSGLSSINPGDAVQLDSGETISQWRQSYFLKFGIRIPEGHIGWDWPQGLSVAAGSPEHVLCHPSMSVRYNRCNQASSVEASVQSLNTLSHMLFPKNPQSEKTVIDEYVNCEKQQRQKDCSSLFTRGQSSSSKNSLHFAADKPIMSYSRNGCPIIPNPLDVREPYSVWPPISSYQDQIYTGGDSVLPPYLQNSKTLGKDITTGRSHGSLVDTETLSSNFQLSLGQPSQQSQCSARSIIQASGSNLIGSRCQPHETKSSDQHVHKSSPRSIKGFRQYSCFPGMVSTSSTSMEHSQLENVNHATGIYGVSNSSEIKHLKSDEFWGSVTSESFGNLRKPFEENAHCKSINATNIDITFGKPHSELSPPKPGELCFSLLRSQVIDRAFSSNMLDSQKLTEVNNVGGNADHLHIAHNINTGPCSKSKGGMWSFSGVTGKSAGMNYPVSHDKGPNVLHLSDDPINRNTFNNTGQLSYPDNGGKDKSNVLRTISSRVDLSNIVSSQAFSAGISTTNLNAVKSSTPLQNKDNFCESPYLLDENQKMAAFYPASAFSCQKIGATTSKNVPELEGSRNFSGKQQTTIPSLVSDSQKFGFKISIVPNTSDVARHALTETLPCITENWGNFLVSATAKGQYDNGKDTETQCQFNSDHPPKRQLLSAPPTEMGNCNQELPHEDIPSKFSCSSSSKLFTGSHGLNNDLSFRNFSELGHAVNPVEPFLGPKLDENCKHVDKVNSFGANKAVEQSMKNVNCNPFQWRDVPRKVAGDATEVASKGFKNLAHHVSKEYEMSNISSGCSAPAVTQVSIEVNNKDSSTVDCMNTGNLVVDEGSGIERCLSSEDDSKRSSEFFGFASEVNLVDRKTSKSSFSNSSHNLIHELRFGDSLTVRKFQNHNDASFAVKAKGVLEKHRRVFRNGKRRRVKWRGIYPSVFASSLPAAHNGAPKSAGDAGLCSGTLKNIQMLPQGDGRCFTCSPCSLGQKLKQKRSASSFTAASREKELHRIHHVEVKETDYESNLNANTDCFRASEAVGRKRLKLVGVTQGLEQDDMRDSASIASGITTKVTASDCMKISKLLDASHRRRRPIVCGKYGIISNCNPLKSAKFLSMRTILKAARRCDLAESQKVNSISVEESEKASSDTDDSHNVGEGKETAHSLGSTDSSDLSHNVKKRKYDGNRSHVIVESKQNTQLRRKSKEVRKFSVDELTIKESDFSCVKSCTSKEGRPFQRRKTRFVSKLAQNAGNYRMFAGGIHNGKKYAKDVESQTSQVLDVFCCICGSSSTDQNNCLLECCRCLIKVHRACYGVSKVPKAQWCCRPCKTSCKNIVCVLCGYGGGAMTQALRCSNILKSMLKAWSIETESNTGNTSFPKTLGSPFHHLSSSKSDHEGDSFFIIRQGDIDSTSEANGSTNLSEHVDTVDIAFATSSAICNSITAGILDSTVKQWVHMVCGLWTPGSRFTDVDTMSAFDVSGAYPPKQDVVCSICQRLGGSCIQCRVANCHVQFHPWCAHQKGLLQSEDESIDNERVGFYGTCMLHAMHHQFKSDSYDTSIVNHEERESNCARTEGYKGRKRDGIHHNFSQHSDSNSGCLVPQEQLNAWIHIIGQKTCTRGPAKLPNSVIESDCRKEYARYKQSRDWKHLLVYKSGIHGLGLYTSQFISRCAMVVEYVGEIVGLHVADKRETEYQAGKKVQYKSACYFFRIDKEHIIDATCKGGIARFVNHSCLPNCVAKVISVRNEKKVIFLAERDIYPGEEVTYDYHFNHEDEGKKIPCYCNSKNCRQYLN